MKTLPALFAALRAACDPRRKVYLATYFQPRSRNAADAGAYVGLTAVAARRVALRFARALQPRELRALLASPVPEHRFVALEILVRQYETGTAAERERIAKLYIREMSHVDHWVLVDTSAPYILGDHLVARRRERTLLFRLASSNDFVRRRIAIVSTAAFIRAGDFGDTLRIAARLLHDENPLIHRAVGWMLREVSKRSRTAATRFLDEHAAAMPRLMLRYAVERLPASDRRRYLRRPGSG